MGQKHNGKTTNEITCPDQGRQREGTSVSKLKQEQDHQILWYSGNQAGEGQGSAG